MKKNLLLLSILCFCTLAGCNNESKQPEDQSEFSDYVSKPTESESEVLGRAIAELGKPYAWGGVGPDSYDASGLVSYCVTGQHIRIGTCLTFMSYPIAESPAPGDICVNENNCGIYVGNGQMIYAPGVGQVVKYGNIESTMIIVRY